MYETYPWLVFPWLVLLMVFKRRISPSHPSREGSVVEYFLVRESGKLLADVDIAASLDSLSK